MKRLPYITLLTALVAIQFVSCDKVAQPSVSGPGEISVTAELQDQQAPTKTTFQSLDVMKVDGNQMHVSCYREGTTTQYLSANAQYSSGKWLFVGKKNDKTYLDFKYYWPESSDKLDFFAYYPATLTNDDPDTTAPLANSYVTIGTYAADTPSFNCVNLPLTSAAQDDSVEEFIYAYEADKQQPTLSTTQTDKHDAVGLTFHRPFAQVYIRLHNAIRSTLNSVTITNVYNNGTFVHPIDTACWTPSGTPGNLVVTSGKKYPEEINNEGIIGGPFIVMPQAIKSNVTLKVNYTATGNANPTEVEAILGMNHTRTSYDVTSDDAAKNRDWKPGHIYYYDINLNGAANEVILTVGVTAWSAQGSTSVTVE